FHTGGLAGATKGNIANADDRNRHAPAFLEAAVVESVPPAGRPAIGHARRPQASAEQIGPQPAALAAHQRPKRVASNGGRALATPGPAHPSRRPGRSLKRRVL